MQQISDKYLTAPVDPSAPTVTSLQRALVVAATDAGFDAAEVDARGFRSGSMNESLTR